METVPEKNLLLQVLSEKQNFNDATNSNFFHFLVKSNILVILILRFCCLYNLG